MLNKRLTFVHVCNNAQPIRNADRAKSLPDKTSLRQITQEKLNLVISVRSSRFILFTFTTRVESFTKILLAAILTTCATHCWAFTSCDAKIMTHTATATTVQSLQTAAIAVLIAAANDFYCCLGEKLEAKYCRAITQQEVWNYTAYCGSTAITY